MQWWGVLGDSLVPAPPEGFLPPQGAALLKLGLTDYRLRLPAVVCCLLSFPFP